MPDTPIRLLSLPQPGAPRTLILPVEEAVRELDAKLLVAALAASRGFRVILGRRDVIEGEAETLPRGFYVSMDLRSPKTVQRFKAAGHVVLGWDEEALVHYPPPIYHSRRVFPESLAAMSGLFAWGGQNVTLWQANPLIAGRLPVFETGNPRADLLRPEMRPYHAAEAEALRGEHGDFVLINTNFGSINNFNPVLNIVTGTDEATGEPVIGKGGSGMPAEFAVPLSAHRTGLFRAFREMIPALAEAMPEMRIIVRPHPMENWDSYAEFAERLGNVEVIHKGSVLPWLIASRVVVHNGCSTAIEGSLLGTPAIAYRPLADEPYDNSLPNGVSREVFALDDLIAAVRETCAAPPDADEVAARTRDAIGPHVTGLSGDFAADRIIATLDALDPPAPPQPEPRGRFFGLFGQSATSPVETAAPKRKKKKQSAVVRQTIAHRFRYVDLAAVQDRLARLSALRGLPEPPRATERAPQLYEIEPDAKRNRAANRASDLSRRVRTLPAFRQLSAAPMAWTRIYGLLRNQPVDVAPMVVGQAEAGELFAAPPPATAVQRSAWTVSSGEPARIAHLAVIPHGTANVGGSVYDRKGQLVHGASHKFRSEGRYPRWRARSNVVEDRDFRRFEPITVLDGPTAVVTSSVSRFYYHWLIDILPRLSILRKCGKQNLKYLYIPYKLPFQKQSLDYLDLGDLVLVPAHRFPIVKAPELVVPCFQLLSGQTLPDWVIPFLRETFRANGSASAGGRRLYISRANAAHRKVANEEDLAEALTPLGFEFVQLEKFGFAEQIRLMTEASVIVAPHGGGLTNLVFTPPGATVVELFPPHNIDLYYRIAEAAGHRYAYVKAALGGCDGWGTWAYVIDPEDVLATLRMVGVR